MDVRLIQVSTKNGKYNFKPEEYTAMPYDVFETLIGGQTNDDEDGQEVIIFKSRDEFLETTSVVDLGIDKEKPVYVAGGTGHIFCFRKGKDEETKVVENGTADTKKN